MPTVIHRQIVQRLLAEGATILDVLPRAEYEAEHIASAMNIPLKELDARATVTLPQGQPVIVYCWDQL